MRLGMWTSSLLGDTQDWVLRLEANLNQLGQFVHGSCELREDAISRYWAIYLNGLKTEVQTYIEDTTFKFNTPAIGLKDSICISVEECGDWADYGYDPDMGPIEYEALTAEHITFSWKPSISIIEYGNSGYSEFSSWSLSGLKRYTNVGQDENRNTIFGWLDLELVTVSSVHTLNLYNGIQLVATGSRTGNGSITLAQANKSGITGSVSLIYGSDITKGVVKLSLKWPKQYQIHYSTGTLSFPRTPEHTVYDDGSSDYFKYTTGKLTAGVYNTSIVAVSEEDVQETTPIVEQETIIAKVKFPYALKYYDGNSTNTRISFYAPNAAYTYKIYRSASLNEPPDMANPITEGAAAGEHIVSLPNYGSGISGKSYIIVRSVNGGVESYQDTSLTITFSSGVVDMGKPIEPRIMRITKSGLDLTVVTEYNHVASNCYPAKIQLFVVPYTSSFNYSSPKDEVVTATFNEFYKSITTLNYTVLSSGFYKVAVRALAFDMITQDINTNYKVVYLNNSAPTTASSKDVRVSRGG